MVTAIVLVECEKAKIVPTAQALAQPQRGAVAAPCAATAHHPAPCDHPRDHPWEDPVGPRAREVPQAPAHPRAPGQPPGLCGPPTCPPRGHPLVGLGQAGRHDRPWPPPPAPPPLGPSRQSRGSAAGLA